MDIDYSFMSLSSTLKMPPDPAAEKKEGAVFGGTVTQLTTLEKNDLRIKGFRSVEIREAIKRLQERSISISYDTLLQDLQQTSKSLKENMYAEFESMIDRAAGILSKVELVQALIKRGYYYEPILHRAMDDHYATLWPQKKCIASLVDKWPQRYRSEAAAIVRMWPVLTINGDIKVDFSSATNHFCQSNHQAGSDPKVLSYPTFFKLIKDIWFHAMKSDDTECLNRVTHLLIVFTQLISDNDCEFRDGSREERHNFVVRNQFEKGLKAVSDVDALAFFLVTDSLLWDLKKEIVLQELIDRALESEVEHLAGSYCEWLEGSAAQTNSEEELTQAGKQIARKIQSQKVITVTKEIYLLEAIAEYMIKYSDKYFFPAQKTRAISHGSYCDKSTFQLLHPVLPPDYAYDEVIERIVRGLNKIFTAPDNQHLFVGTAEYNSLQNRRKWKQVIDKVRKNNWDEKNAAARITIDATLQKVRAVRVIEQRLSRMVNQVVSVIADREDQRRALVKQQFHQAGFEPQIDPDDQSVYYPASYYSLRKQALFALKQCKDAVESVIGTTIPFCATYSQISQTLRCFRQLPIEESRYWQMSSEYARNTLIPELVQDLSLSELAITHQALQEKQKKFITCKCLSCTICDVDVYLCRCPTGIGRKLSEKLSRYKSKALYDNVKKYVESDFCTADLNCHVPFETLKQLRSAKLLKDDAVFIDQLNDIIRTCSEGHEDDVSDVSTDDDGEAASDSGDSIEWDYGSADSYGSGSWMHYSNDFSSQSSISSSSDDFRLNAHLTRKGTLCPKRHVLDLSAIASQVTRNIVFRMKKEMIEKGADGATPWKAEAEGARAARHFYQTVGVPEFIINSNNVAEWFVSHPSGKKKAVEMLGKYAEIKHLIDKETLEFRPRSFKEISCEVVYHDLDNFQEHLGKVQFHDKSPGLPLNESDNGRYLHRTFCLCCRINFGQQKELKEHLKIHHEKMEAAFAQIEKKNLAVRDDSILLLPDSENNALADLQLRLHQQGLDVQLPELFKDLAV